MGELRKRDWDQEAWRVSGQGSWSVSPSRVSAFPGDAVVFLVGDGSVLLSAGYQSRGWARENHLRTTWPCVTRARAWVRLPSVELRLPQGGSEGRRPPSRSRSPSSEENLSQGDVGELLPGGDCRRGACHTRWPRAQCFWKEAGTGRSSRGLQVVTACRRGGGSGDLGRVVMGKRGARSRWAEVGVHRCFPSRKLDGAFKRWEQCLKGEEALSRLKG